MREYPRLPELPPATPDEPAILRGGLVLAFIVREGVTATLTDQDLELADHARRLVVCGRYELPSTLEAVATAGRLIAGALAARHAVDAAPATLPQGSPSGPPEGPIAPLSPRPKVNPPVGAHARVEVAF